MARHSAPYSFHSLKGKITLATSAMAVFTCAFGSLVYLTVSLLTMDTFFTVFIPFLLLAFIILVFGWWLSNEVVGPIQKLSLLAKSLERSPMASVPKSSGAAETDELLETLTRNSRQLQLIVNLMEDVTNGKFEVAITPLQNSERLTNSFQKLLAKITDSLYAKQDLDILRNAVAEISTDVSRVRNGNLDVEIRTDLHQTKDLTDSLKFLVHRLSDLVAGVHAGSARIVGATADVRRTIQEVVVRDESRAREMSQAAGRLKESPNRVQKISEELSGSISSANQSLEKARKGSQAAEQNSLAVGTLRKQVKEAVKKIQMLNERSQEIAKVAKSLDDLANRSNLVALNASIQAASAKDEGAGFSMLAEEVERLSGRADSAGKQMSAINKAIAAEITEAEHALQSTVSEIANISKYALETGDSLGELERYIGQFLNLQAKLAANSNQQTLETEQALEVFSGTISDSARAIDSLRETNLRVADLSAMMDDLKLSISDFRITQPAPAAVENVGVPSEPAMEYSAEFAVTAEAVEEFQLQGDA